MWFQNRRTKSKRGKTTDDLSGPISPANCDHSQALDEDGRNNSDAPAAPVSNRKSDLNPSKLGHANTHPGQLDIKSASTFVNGNVSSASAFLPNMLQMQHARPLDFPRFCSTGRSYPEVVPVNQPSPVLPPSSQVPAIAIAIYSGPNT